jgi:hypothetical protein
MHLVHCVGKQAPPADWCQRANRYVIQELCRGEERWLEVLGDSPWDAGIRSKCSASFLADAWSMTILDEMPFHDCKKPQDTNKRL